VLPSIRVQEGADPGVNNGENKKTFCIERTSSFLLLITALFSIINTNSQYLFIAHSHWLAHLTYSGSSSFIFICSAFPGLSTVPIGMPFDTDFTRACPDPKTLHQFLITPESSSWFASPRYVVFLTLLNHPHTLVTPRDIHTHTLTH